MFIFYFRNVNMSPVSILNVQPTSYDGLHANSTQNHLPFMPCNLTSTKPYTFASDPHFAVGLSAFCEYFFI